jgi:hypothetical protein
MGIEGVHRLHRLRRVVEIPADEFANMGPVLLFDVGVVILLIRSASGERDLPPVRLNEKAKIPLAFSPL